MKVKTIFSALLKYAREESYCEEIYKHNPTEENKKSLELAKANHESYKKLCLEADEMIY